MEAEVYAQYQTVIVDCGIEIEQSEALVLLGNHIGETGKSSVLKFIHRFVHIFVDISAGTQKPQTKVCGFSLWRLLGSANLRCLS